jgi:D-alanine transaminase
VARRDHAFPTGKTKPALVLTTKNTRHLGADPGPGVAVKSERDIRWERCDIKTVALLPNVLAKQAARESGAYEAWLIDDKGCITEGASTNAWIVDSEGVLRTRDIQANILRGVTRKSVLRVATERGLKVAERPFTPEEALASREAFITGASTQVTPVIRLNGHLVGGGEPGPVAKRLRELYIAEARRDVL